VGGRGKWASPASISRLLAAVEPEQAERYSQWLLNEALPIGAVAKHEAVRAYDRFGEGWEFFDWDATCTVLRQRALPSGPEMPEARRRCADLAAPGHPGRKRGEVQLGRATQQHSGSSQWVGLWCEAGNAPRGEQTRQAIEAMKLYCERHALAVARAVLRCDGQAGGGMRTLLAAEQAGLAYLTRLSRYDVLDWSEVERHLEQARFEPVEDSLSGPRREAAEMGSLRLVAHDRLPEESEKPTLRSRIVLSRFPASEPRRGVGIVRGSWQYEMFATNLAPERWPAAESVAAYYGRCAQENRFLQEDNHLGLDRILSYHLPGQHLASAIGLFCWNLRLALGAELHALEQVQSLPLQPKRHRSRCRRPPSQLGRSRSWGNRLWRNLRRLQRQATQGERHRRRRRRERTQARAALQLLHSGLKLLRRPARGLQIGSSLSMPPRGPRSWSLIPDGTGICRAVACSAPMQWPLPSTGSVRTPSTARSACTFAPSAPSATAVLCARSAQSRPRRIFRKS
jgi:hypothetical protein